MLTPGADGQPREHCSDSAHQCFLHTLRVEGVKVRLIRQDTCINPSHPDWTKRNATRRVQTIRQHLAGEGDRAWVEGVARTAFCQVLGGGFRREMPLLLLVCLFRAALAAYGASQARGRIRAAAADLHHSHSNARPKPHLQPTPQPPATPNP